MGRVCVRIVSLVCVVIFILHLFACLFHSVALWNETTLSWVEASGIVDRTSQIDRCCHSSDSCAMFLRLNRLDVLRTLDMYWLCTLLYIECDASVR